MLKDETTVDKHTISVLEFFKVKEILMKFTVSVIAEEIVNRLQPTNDLENILSSLQETSEMREVLMIEGSTPPFLRTGDIRRELKLSKINGTIIDAEKILNILKVLVASRELKKYFLKAKGKYPLIKKKLEKINLFRDLEKEITYCIGENAEVLDRASSELRIIRKEILKKEQNIKDRLEKMIRSSQLSDIIQEPIITIRQNRYVIPIKQDRKGKFPGVIHDKSDSGATLFIEPFALVELNNSLRQLLKDEEREVLKILQKITSQIGERADDIYKTFTCLGEIDFIHARTVLANKMNAVEPRLNRKGIICLRRARHPLLKGNVVSINMHIGNDFNILLITGPNTGGKTVALKTVGIITLMAQCGLHIPAEDGSEIAIFDKVFCDIGDEQNIEQNLSTFSSHMKYIVQILEEANAHSLVLLDELGAGTDPTEGAALSMAILEDLKKKEVRVVATTHHDTLKTYAYLTEGVCNARVEFDEKTLKPTYQISIGLPGKSCAFIISKRLGLSSKVISMAQDFLSQEKIKADSLIEKIEQDKKTIEQEKIQIEKIKQNNYLVKNQLENELFRSKEDKRKKMLEAYQEAEEIVKKTQEKANKILKNLRHVKISDKQSSKDIKQETMKLAQRIKEEKNEIEPQEKNKDKEEIKKGDFVLIKSLNKSGNVISVSAKTERCKVQTENIKMLVSIFDVEKINKAIRKTETYNNYEPHSNKNVYKEEKHFLSKIKNFNHQLSIRQFKIEDAKIKLEKYLDDAYYLGVSPVYIIHGKGKGILREEVRKLLDIIPYIESYRMGNINEGGIGVTVAYLKK